MPNASPAPTDRFTPDDRPVGAPSSQATSAQAALDRLGRQFRELSEYVSHYLSARMDGLRVSLRNVLIYAVLGVVGLLAAAAFVITSVVLALNGLAGALGALFGGRWWLGNLAAGVILLGLLAGGVVFGLKYLTRTFKQQTVSKYEQRKRRQQSEFGHDTRERASRAAQRQ